jgi:hypothetical protein
MHDILYDPRLPALRSLMPTEVPTNGMTAVLRNNAQSAITNIFCGLSDLSVQDGKSISAAKWRALPDERRRALRDSRFEVPEQEEMDWGAEPEDNLGEPYSMLLAEADRHLSKAPPAHSGRSHRFFNSSVKHDVKTDGAATILIRLQDEHSYFAESLVDPGIEEQFTGGGTVGIMGRWNEKIESKDPTSGTKGEGGWEWKPVRNLQGLG